MLTNIGINYLLIEPLSISKDTSSFHVVMARVLLEEAWKVTTEMQDTMENNFVL